MSTEQHVDDMTEDERIEFRCLQLDELVGLLRAGEDIVALDKIVSSCETARTEWLVLALEILASTTDEAGGS